MTEFRKAPDNQPTENIELQLRVARASRTDWEVSVQHHKLRLKSAQEMVQESEVRVRELEYQLEHRKAEVTGR